MIYGMYSCREDFRTIFHDIETGGIASLERATSETGSQNLQAWRGRTPSGRATVRDPEVSDDSCGTDV